MNADQPGDHHGNEELPDDGLEESQGTRQIANRRDVSITESRLGDETVIEKRLEHLYYNFYLLFDYHHIE